MKKVTAKKLSMEAFKNYGSYANMINPEDKGSEFKAVAFYADRVALDLGQTNKASFSVTRVEKRPLVIDACEYHNNSGECILPMDGDVVMHVGAPTRGNELDLDTVEVFYVPKGTMVSFRKGTWHCAPFAVNTDYVNILIVLPERTYANDCFFWLVPEEQRVEIGL